MVHACTCTSVYMYACTVCACMWMVKVQTCTYMRMYDTCVYVHTFMVHVCIHVRVHKHNPGAKVRVITREARYYAKTRAFASFHAIISRAHAARAVT